jgi:hypothetical protein
VTGTGRFDRTPDAGEAAEQLEDQVRDARDRVFRSYVRAREKGVDLLYEPTAPAPEAAREQGGDGVPA